MLYFTGTHFVEQAFEGPAFTSSQIIPTGPRIHRGKGQMLYHRGEEFMDSRCL